MQANAAMEQEMLQDQLDRAWKDNQALQGRLEAALGLTTALASACKPVGALSPANVPLQLDILLAVHNHSSCRAWLSCACLAGLSR